jgi:hypothetical protein
VDVAFEVEYGYDMGTDYRVTGYWLTVGYENKYWRAPNGKNRQPELVSFDIKAHKLNEWLKVSLPQTDVSLRKCDWTRLPRRVV